MRPGARRVAITGYGVVAPCGIGRQSFWQGLNGPGITSGRSVDVDNWDPTPYFANPKEARRADRFEQFALAAAAEAFEQAGRPTADPGRFGVIFATGVGGLRSTEEQIGVLIEKGERRVSPFLVPMMMPNAAGAAIRCGTGCRARTRRSPRRAQRRRTPSVPRRDIAGIVDARDRWQRECRLRSVWPRSAT
ncbi:MAG: beta-ketoacyl synthase N-terminal-like domain-containing protein [Ilumatobacteraceae bacterium]